MKTSQINKVVLLVWIFIVMGLGAEQAALGGDEFECAQYAKTAVSQNQRNLEGGCGFSGAKWNSDYNLHYQWCVSVAKRIAEFETSQREYSLRNDCPGVKPSQPQGEGSLAGSTRICDQYAKTAVLQNKVNIDKSCGFSGPRWGSDYNVHYQWCVNAPGGFADFETSQREVALKQDCPNNLTNRPMESPPLKEYEPPKLLSPTAVPNLVPKVETQNGLHTFNGKVIEVKVRNKGTGYVWGDEYKVGIRPAGASGQEWMGIAVGKKMVPGQEVIVEVPWSLGTGKLPASSKYVAEVDIENKVYEGDSGENDNVSEEFQLMDMSYLKQLPTEPQTAPLAKKQIDADLAITDASFFGPTFSFVIANKGPDLVPPEIVKMMKVHTNFIFDDPSKNYKCTVYFEDFNPCGLVPPGYVAPPGYSAGCWVHSTSYAPSSTTRFGCPPGTWSPTVKWSYALVTLEWPMDVVNLGNMPTQLADPDASNNQRIYYYPKNYKPFGK